MAAETFDTCLSSVFREEGGFVNDPRDPGGATNMGITRATLATWRKRAVSVADVKALTRAEAAEIYRARYWTAIRGDELPPGLDLVVFDCCVNSGPSRAIRILQRVLAVAEDGQLGPATIASARTWYAPAAIGAYSRERLSFLQGLPTWRTFGTGWRNRVERVEAAAHALAAARPKTAPSQTVAPSGPLAPIAPDTSAPAAKPGIVAAFMRGLSALAGRQGSPS